MQPLNVSEIALRLHWYSPNHLGTQRRRIRQVVHAAVRFSNGNVVGFPCRKEEQMAGDAPNRY